MKRKLLLTTILLISLFNINVVNAANQKATCKYSNVKVGPHGTVNIEYNIEATGSGTITFTCNRPQADSFSKVNYKLKEEDFINDTKDGIRCPNIGVSLLNDDNSASDDPVYEVRKVKTGGIAADSSSTIDNGTFIDSSIETNAKASTCRVTINNNPNNDLIIKYDGVDVKIYGGPNADENTIANASIVGEFDSLGTKEERIKAKREYYAKKFGNGCQGAGTLMADCSGSGDDGVCRIYEKGYQDQNGSLNGKEAELIRDTSEKEVLGNRACRQDSSGKFYCKDKKECSEEEYKSQCKVDFGDICKDGGCDIDIEGICEKPNVARSLKFVGLLVNIAKIIVPAIIIIMGIINLFNIITSGNDVADAKKYAKNIATRVLIGVLVFLIPGLINFIYDEVMNITGLSNDGKDKLGNCINCILDVDNCNVNE